jgi:SAM-dependent methyltransferase
MSMPKDAEVQYVVNMAKMLKVSSAEVEHHLVHKPFADASRWTYLLDMGQIMKLLPPPPARVLDLGVGSGWTSEMLARCGYSVVGLDIAPDMIAIARGRITDSLDLRFEVCDYEAPTDLGEFDAVVIYDALHHAEDEQGVLANAFRGLKEGGVFISMEPGAGHSTTEATRDVVAKFGTTEKDMPYERQAELLRAAGFVQIRQYLRLSQLPLECVATEEGHSAQWAHFTALTEATKHGLTSVVVAVKDAAPEGVPGGPGDEVRL